MASGLGLGVLLRQLEGKEREDGDWRKGAKGFGIGPGDGFQVRSGEPHGWCLIGCTVWTGRNIIAWLPETARM